MKLGPGDSGESFIIVGGNYFGFPKTFWRTLRLIFMISKLKYTWTLRFTFMISKLTYTWTLRLTFMIFKLTYTHTYQGLTICKITSRQTDKKV